MTDKTRYRVVVLKNDQFLTKYFETEKDAIDYCNFVVFEGWIVVSLAVSSPEPITLRVDYDEFKPDTYRGFVVDLGGGVHYRFYSESDNIMTDRDNAINFAVETSLRFEPEKDVITSSSFDQFFQDMMNGL